MTKVIRIGTRDSQLALWQATRVQQLLEQHDFSTELIKIKSEGDLDLKTPLYEMGVQGVFTRSLDAALLQNRVDIAVHSMKDVPTLPAEGICQAAVLKRGSPHDLVVFKTSLDFLSNNAPATIATGSIRRKAQWLHRYPGHRIVDLRGNVNTRLRRLAENNWDGAIFAAAGLERTGLRPEQSATLDWMLPAPAQGAIMVVCRREDTATVEATSHLNDPETALCAGEERAFLRTLLGGCSTPISAYAYVHDREFLFEGNILTTDGKEKREITKKINLPRAAGIGKQAAEELLAGGGAAILAQIKAAGITGSQAGYP
jgi:hydroxymethylbilane synthase